MIERAVIWGLHRGSHLVPQGEISQMMGRCGRSYERSGHATLLVDSSELSIAREYLAAGPGRVESQMWDIGKAAFLVIPEINRRDGMDEGGFREWFARSLAHTQGKALSWREVSKHLIDNGCAHEKEGIVHLTSMGRLSMRLYFTPERTHMMRERLEWLASSGDMYEPKLLSWALAGREIPQGDIDDSDYQDYAYALSGMVPHLDSCEILDCYMLHCLMTCARPPRFRSELAASRKDAGRVVSLAEGVSSIFFPSVGEVLRCFRECLSTGESLSQRVLSMQLPGCPRELIIELESLALHSLADIARRPHIVEMYGSDSLRRYYNEHICEPMPGETEGELPPVSAADVADADPESSRG